uniref:Uncharacterized protein n=1 Tax=Psilocybe cubensis TaxID=181762 RepID=A0A8H7XXA4_PSICU
MSQERVPPEIQTQIIDSIVSDHSGYIILQPDCAQTLRTCLRVSPTFRWSAKRYLFKFISLFEDDEDAFRVKLKHLRSLVDLPDMEISILRHIRIFQMSAPITSILGNPEPSRCKQIIEDLDFILNAFRHSEARLHTFEFHGPLFSSLPSKVVRSLQNLIRSPTLLSLRLCEVQDLPKDVLQGTSIIHLTVLDCNISDTMGAMDVHLPLSQIATIETTDLPMVHALYPETQRSMISNGEACLKSVCLRIDMRTCFFGGLNKECDTVAELFPSVKSLYIVFDSNGIICYLHFNPLVLITHDSTDLVQLFLTPPMSYSTKLNNFNYLTLRYGPTDLSRTSLPTKAYVSHAITVLAAWPPSLQRLTLIFDNLFYCAEDISLGMPIEAWTKLDDILLNVDIFPHLGGVDIKAFCLFPNNIMTNHSRKVEQLRMEQEIKLALPTLHKQGKMTVAVSCR